MNLRRVLEVRTLRALLVAALLSELAVLLSGCAATPPHDDIVTASDEPEIRKRARIRLQLAVGYFQQGQTTVALDETKQALNIDPGFGDAYNLRGLVYMRLNDQRLAEESFQRAIALSPQDGNIQHNYGWMLCQQHRYDDAISAFNRALANPRYDSRAKTWLTMGICELQAGHREDAEQSLTKSYELDAANPVTGYNLSKLLFEKGDMTRAQFYIRRINNSDQANAESLWLGIKVEDRLGNRIAREQLGSQLRQRFAKSPELTLFERGAFNE